MSTWAHSSADRGTREGVATEIRAWIRAATDSPIYSRLASEAAEDPALLDLVARIDNVPPMNLLFGAVQLLRGEPLADLPYAEFRAFVLANEQEIVEIGCTRRTQTNEVRRAAVILPFVAEAAARLGGGPVHAVEIGASAGLVTCLDEYAYDYGAGAIGESALTLACENRGGFPLPDAVPTFASRTAVDLAPVDPGDPDAVAWLEALIWPEHTERRERFRAAMEIRRRTDVTMIAGDALRELPVVIEALPPGPVVVWHTIALYQMDAEWHSRLDGVMRRIAGSRPVERISFEPAPGSTLPVIRTALAMSDAPVVGVGHPHGEWLARS
jgi:hypothetical protein